MANNKKWKRPNAQKHGVFAAAPIIPGEDPQEFEELCATLVKEWTPDGATEVDAVLSLANAMWRKRRAQRFVETQLMINMLDVHHPSFNEIEGLRRFAILIKQNPEIAFEEWAKVYFRPDRINYLEKKVPRAKFHSDSEWAQAIENEMSSVLTPPREVGDDTKFLVGYTECLLLKSSDLFEKELALIERLDAMIDRLIKRLVQIKATKQMLGQYPQSQKTIKQSEKQSTTRIGSR